MNLLKLLFGDRSNKKKDDQPQVDINTLIANSIWHVGDSIIRIVHDNVSVDKAIITSIELSSTSQNMIDLTYQTSSNAVSHIKVSVDEYINASNKILDMFNGTDRISIIHIEDISENYYKKVIKPYVDIYKNRLARLENALMCAKAFAELTQRKDLESFIAFAIASNQQKMTDDTEWVISQHKEATKVINELELFKDAARNADDNSGADKQS